MLNVIEVKNLSKKYKLGTIGSNSFNNDFSKMLRNLRSFIGKDTRSDSFEKRGYYVGKSFWALKDVSFSVKKGEILGVIGKNGAGKSTLLKIISQITSPTTGSVNVMGKIASLLEVGTGFHPDLTGKENIFMNGTILGMKKEEIKRKLDQIIEFSGVEKFIDTPVKRYSSGMYVRLAFSVAAHLEPEILIIDEVLAVGDAEFQKRCLGKMKDVTVNDGRTVLFVSHNMAAISALCEKTVLLDGGIIADMGPTNDVIKLYLKKEVIDTNIHLLSRKDRRGNGDVRFSGVEFYDQNNLKIITPITGQLLKIRLNFEFIKTEVKKNCRLSVGFDRDDKHFILLSSELVLSESMNLNRNSYVDFIVDKLPLTKGEYNLSLFFESNSIIEDWIDDVILVNVEDGNYYGTGKNFPAGWAGQTVLTEFNVTVNQ